MIFAPDDFRQKTPTGEHQAFYHPKAAADNSARIFDISEKEWNAILTHMFPLGPVPEKQRSMDHHHWQIRYALAWSYATLR